MSEEQPPKEPLFKKIQFKDWKADLQRLGKKLNEKLNKENLKKAIQNFDPQAFADSASKAFQNKGASFYGTLATVTLSTFFAADLISLVVEGWIPEPPPPRPARMGSLNRSKTIGDYEGIFTRNLFNSQGLIPGEEDGQGGNGFDPGGTPIRTTLPLNLIGTIIMKNELRSIATIEDKTASQVYPVRIDDEIPGKIRVLKIEPKKVIFLNFSSSRREFIDLPDDVPLTNPILTPGKVSAGPGIERVASNQFSVSRNEVDKALADFNNILTQARAVPNFENGVPAGYKLFQIVPGSIYDKLGLQNGDVIAGLNGQPINDPAKAFELLSELKTSSHMELQVKKDGRPSTYVYDIH